MSFCKVVCEYKTPRKQHPRTAKHSSRTDAPPAMARRSPLLTLDTVHVVKDCWVNLEESCMITQFTGKIIKSLVSSLFRYTGYSSWVLPLWTRGRILCLDLWQRAWLRRVPMALHCSLSTQAAGSFREHTDQVQEWKHPVTRWYR